MSTQCSAYRLQARYQMWAGRHSRRIRGLAVKFSTYSSYSSTTTYWLTCSSRSQEKPSAREE